MEHHVDKLHEQIHDGSLGAVRNGPEPMQGLGVWQGRFAAGTPGGRSGLGLLPGLFKALSAG
jgi:hypothetical protein